MSDNPILDELYAVREQILAECGGTMHGLYLRYSQRRPGVIYADLKSDKPQRVRVASPRRTPSRKKSALVSV